MWTQFTAPTEYPGFKGLAYDSALSRVLRVAAADSQLKVWAWDGAAWSLLSAQPDPGNTGASVAFDSARNRLVLFGGPNMATWEWDGATWIQAQVSGPSISSAYAPIVYDAARARITMVRRGSAAAAETWTYDGASWQSWPTPALNIANHRIAYDSDRQRIILLVTSHAVYTGTPYVEVWEWNGTQWSQSPDRPFETVGSVAYDSSRHRLIVTHNTTTTHETWELDPAAGLWVQRTLNGPRAVSPSMSFDVSRARTVFYDNFLGTASPQTWEYNGAGTITPTVIVDQPKDLDAPIGSSAVISVIAQSTGPLTYQWRKYGVPLSNGGNISGADTDTLVIDPVSATDLGRYSVLISNGCADVLSIEAQLFIIGSACYPNCDNSTLAPVLNVNDFVCFNNRFASGCP
jgi:hypothetical protein